MRALAAMVLVSSVCAAPLVAQERDRSVVRIGLALERPSPIFSALPPVESTLPRKVGILTLLPPTAPGEMIRVSIPIGELVMRAVRGVAAANQRRQEAAARRKVEAALEEFAKRRGGTLVPPEAERRGGTLVPPD